ncbi:MAG: hypothetical protein KGO22_15775 [Gammaproteobacteria bacterium]|nr:hypothetical protein [Gammaproteobacteria bacterium]
MKLRPIRSALHTRTELTIPWFVNGSLSTDAEPALREHLSTCPECAEDYEEQMRVREAMRAEGPLVFAAESSYQKLLTRMQYPQADREASAALTAHTVPAAVRYSFRRSPAVVRWLAAAVILQAFALGLGAWAWHSSVAARDAGYVTLTSAGPVYGSGPRVRILFKTDLSVGALQGVLNGVGAHIIDGPADGDVYTLGFAQPPDSAAALEKRIAVLRGNPVVLFAEPVQDGVR